MRLYVDRSTVQSALDHHVKIRVYGVRRRLVGWQRSLAVV